MIRNTLIKKTGSTFEDAEDITQQAFVKAMKSMDSFQNRSSFKTWVYRITYNVFLDSIKSKKRFYSLNEIEEDENGNQFRVLEESINHDSPDLILSQRDETEVCMEKLSKLKAKLSEAQQRVYDLVFVQDKSYKEAAKELDCPIGTIMSRVFFTRQKLGKIIDKNPIKTL